MYEQNINTNTNHRHERLGAVTSNNGKISGTGSRLHAGSDYTPKSAVFAMTLRFCGSTAHKEGQHAAFLGPAAKSGVGMKASNNLSHLKY